jgi:hypothetical protein
LTKKPNLDILILLEYLLRHIISKLCGISEPSYYIWKNKSHIELVALIEKYFTTEDLQEFLDTGKVSKYDNKDRIKEILRLLTKYTTKTLSSTLANALESNDNTSGTYKRLISYTDTASKLNFIKDLKRLLLDLYSEIRNESSTQFQMVFKDFNEKIGFDFNEDDISTITQIISRYHVFNTIYDLDKLVEQ